MERNGEDYICPNCTILQVQAEPDAEAADQQDAGVTPGSADGTALMSMGTVEQRASEDQGIKGRIEKAAHPSGKKKLKIFQPVAEAPGAARCIGPGCCSTAQPDSVYCSSGCILRHAAATMELLRSGPKEKAKLKAAKLRPPTWSVQAGIKISSVHKRPAPEKKENPTKKVVLAPPRGEAVGKEAPSESTPSWASDHNYNAVKPEKSAALSSALLCKCMYDLGLASRALPLTPEGASWPLRDWELRWCPDAGPEHGQRCQSWKHVPVCRMPFDPVCVPGVRDVCQSFLSSQPRAECPC